MAKKKLYIPLKLHCGKVSIGDEYHDIKLPDRCKGVMLCFETKTAARNFMGKDSEIMTVELVA